MRVRVFVRLKPGVLDVQGKAVERDLPSVGFAEVRDVRIGRLVEFEVDSTSPETVRARAEELCRTLLANPVIESYEVQLVHQHS